MSVTNKQLREPRLVRTHLIGLFCFLSFSTLPSDILLIRYWGSVPIKVSGILLFSIILLTVVQRSQRKPYLKFFGLFLLVGYVVATLTGLDPASVFIESIPALEFLGVLFVVSELRPSRDFAIIAKYATACLWVSLFVILAMLVGLIYNPYQFRASFSGTAISEVGLGRLVTPTHLLSGICIGIVGHMWVNKRIKLTNLVAVLFPAIIIAGIASTRLLVVLIIVPIIWAAFLRSNPDGRRRLMGFSVVIFAAPALVGLLSQTIAPQLSVLSGYLDNFMARIFSGFLGGQVSEIDGSSFYREQETYYAAQYVALHPVFGGGFSSTFMSTPLVSGDSFLGLKGNAYSHNTYLWILVKTGFLGLAFFLGGLLKAIIPKVKPTLNLDFHLFLSSLVSLVVVGFIWNILANSPDSIAFAGVLGLAIASLNSVGNSAPQSITPVRSLNRPSGKKN